MKKMFSMKSLVTAGICGMIFAGVASAQTGGTGPAATGTAQPAAARPEVPVVIIDMELLMRNHPKLTEFDEQLKAEAMAFQPTMQKGEAEIVAMRGELTTMTPGTAEYTQKEAAMVARATALQQELDLKNRDLGRRQLLERYSVYCEIQSAITKFCETYNVNLVLISSSAKLKPVDPNNTTEAMEAMQRRIAVYVKTSHDITDAIATMCSIPLQPQSTASVATTPAAATTPTARTAISPTTAAPR